MKTQRFPGNNLVDLRLLSRQTSLVRPVFIRNRLSHQRGKIQLGNRPFNLGKLLRTGENRSQRVIVLRRNRVELMIVAPGTGNRQPQNRLASHIDLLVNNVIKHFDLVLFRHQLRAQRQKPGGNDPGRIDGLSGWRRQQIAGDLLADELVVRHVSIERINNVISIAPGMGIAVILIGPGRIGIARHVQPMAAPFFPVPRRGQQPINDLGKSRRRVVSQKRRHLAGAGRQSG